MLVQDSMPASLQSLLSFYINSTVSAYFVVPPSPLSLPTFLYPTPIYLSTSLPWLPTLLLDIHTSLFHTCHNKYSVAHNTKSSISTSQTIISYQPASIATRTYYMPPAHPLPDTLQ